MSDWETLKKDLIQELKPSEDEDTQILAFAEKIATKINAVLKESNLEAVAELHGSVAHGTWIREQKELDIFIIFSEYIGREQLKTALDVLRMLTDWDFTEAYAEHPYLRTIINGYQLDIVPCFRVKEDGKLYSSTDRTPLHTKWLRKRIKGLEEEVRILKKFLMNLDLYGAEIRIGGFSGYLCELLIIYYGSFWNFIKKASKWEKKTALSFAIDISKKFDDPLVFIDPVDKGRNVASALREESYSTFISAAQSFSQNPSKVFFKPRIQQVSSEIVIEELDNRPTDILFLVIEENKADVPDVLWGQIHKSRQALEHKITEQGFKPLRSTAWSNEKTRHIFIYELDSRTIPEAMKHVGPPAYLENNVNEFIATYRDNPKTIAGPDLVGDRWYVLVKRDYTNIKQLFGNLLKDGGISIGISRKLGIRILQHHRTLLNEEIEDYLIDGFEDYLYYWLKGRPLWIE
jgi:tRNA nucleotidyltransferase (CCA-adding enzyme)